MMTIQPGAHRPSLESQLSGSKRHSIATYAHDYDFFWEIKEAANGLKSDEALSEARSEGGKTKQRTMSLDSDVIEQSPKNKESVLPIPEESKEHVIIVE